MTMRFSATPAAVLLALTAMVPTSAVFAEDATEPHPISMQLAEIASAALESETGRAEAIFANDLALVSQSGKLYGREAALFDLGNGFDTWRNEDVVIRAEGDVAIVTLINRRTRTGLELGEAAFRVMQLWKLRDGTWQLVGQSSVRLKDAN